MQSGGNFESPYLQVQSKGKPGDLWPSCVSFHTINKHSPSVFSASLMLFLGDIVVQKMASTLGAYMPPSVPKHKECALKKIHIS